MISIAVDAMGGDNAPREIVHGAVLASKANPVRIFLVGDDVKRARRPYRGVGDV